MANRPTADIGRFRTVPARSADFAHLTLDGLRAYRRALTAEEGRVSYWRRIIQARLDLVRLAETGTAATTADYLRGVFDEARPEDGRRALQAILPVDDMPPLPDLVELWAREPVGHAPSDERLARDLSRAETQLSSYRTALHKRLAAATSELIARYREEPTLCLSALPTQRVVRVVNG